MKINLTVTEQELSLILQAIGIGRYIDVAGLIDNLVRQAKEQGIMQPPKAGNGPAAGNGIAKET
jgi:hypothetical protein